MQRRLANATRNAGLEATVSARALMARAPSRADFAHAGMRPHRGRSTLRPSSRCSTTVRGSVGATFQEGWNAAASSVPAGSPRTSASKIRATSSGGVCWVIRPHMRAWWHDHAAPAPIASGGFAAHSPRGTGDRTWPPAVRRHRRRAAAAGHGRRRAGQLPLGHTSAMGERGIRVARRARLGPPGRHSLWCPGGRCQRSACGDCGGGDGP